MSVFYPFNCRLIWAKYLISEEMPNLCGQENHFLDDSQSGPDKNWHSDLHLSKHGLKKKCLVILRVLQQILEL